MCLDLAIYSMPSESLPDRVCGHVRGFGETGATLRFNFASQWSSLTISDGRHPGGRCPATQGYSDQLRWPRKSA
jgi:hypothetical protein